MKIALCTLATLMLAMPAAAQEVASPEPVTIEVVAPGNRLPANTEVFLSMNQEVTTRGNRWREGDTFTMTVLHDVYFENWIVIPKGSRARGHITWRTGKAVFGKSGKMNIVIDYVEVGGRRIALTADYRTEGKGNALATIGALATGPFASLITGHSATIPQGAEFMARTLDDVYIVLPATR